MSLRHKGLLAIASGLLSIVLANLASADDSEIFYSNGGSSLGPNVLLVVDTSGSMSSDAPITASSYTSTTTYSGGCTGSTIYYLSSTPSSTFCSSSSKKSAAPQTTLANFQCTAGLTSLNSLGSYNDTFIQWSSGWSQSLVTGTKNLSNDVACTKDFTSSSSSATTAGNGHGYPALNATGSKTPAEWTATSTSAWWSSSNKGTSYTAYSGNYLNYLAIGSTAKLTKLQVVQQELTTLLPLLPDNWNVALMTYNYASTGGTSGVATGLTSGSTLGSCGGITTTTSSSSGSSSGGNGGNGGNGGGGNGSGYGGCVLVPFGLMSDNTHQTLLVNTVNALQATGNTPLVGTMYEAYRYMEGLSESFGKYADVTSCATTTTAPSSTFTPVYQSPVVAANSACQHNYVVFLTDGLPNESPSYVDSLIYSGLYGASSGASICTDALPSNSQCSGGSTINGGTCLSSLTSYMNQTPKIKATTTAKYPIQSYFLAFGVDPCLVLGYNYLAAAAKAGGGTSYNVANGDDLLTAFNEITTQVLQITTSFTAPTVAVNAFNRTQTLNDLFISMFEPNTNYHWSGNLKHYTLSTSGSTAGQIVDSKGNSAVSAGFIASTAYSAFSGEPSTDSDGYTTAVNDGANVNLGGAAQLLPCWQQRYVFTYINASTTYTSPVALGTVPSSQVAGTAIPCSTTSTTTQSTSTSSYQLSTGNTLLTSAVVGIPTSDTTTTAAQVINYALGADLNNVQKTNVTSGTTTTYGTRLSIGDTLHGQPGYVFYGNPSNIADTSLANAYIYSTDNDGFLHAVNALTGQEAWAFVPQDLLADLYPLYKDTVQPSKSYTLDGSVVVLKYDQNGNGVIDGANDRVIIYFGNGRGGSNYYALDVTNPLSPKFMWTIGPTQLPGIGQTWSTPTIAKVNTGLSAQVSNQKLVLIFGGGYDPTEDAGFNTTDAVGRSVYMVDAVSGALLWQGLLTTASTTAPSSTTFAKMTNAIPSSVLVLDTNGDGYADRMYVGDLGGQLWRFDITNYTTTIPFAVAGGVIASLGGQIQSDAPNLRRFYEQPDIALVQNSGQALFFDIALGSGYRGHPLDTTVYDRMYSIRDFSPLTPLTTAGYAALKVIVDASVTPSSSQQALTDITSAANLGTTPPTVSVSAPGWQYDLDSATSATGEKVLSQASIFSGEVLFTTYTPASSTTTATACTAPQIGTNRFYALGATNGAQLAALGGTHITLQQTGIAPTLRFLFPGSSTSISGSSSSSGGGSSSSSGSSSSGGGGGGQINFSCTAGVEILSICKSFNSVVKTYWTEQDSK